jgi:hypothetical protein
VAASEQTAQVAAQLPIDEPLSGARTLNSRSPPPTGEPRGTGFILTPRQTLELRMQKRTASALIAAVLTVVTAATFSTSAGARPRHSHGGEGGGGTSRSCLTGSARALLGRVEAKFGAMRLISTCRPGATIAGSGRPSRHASGNAIDFDAGSRKGAVVQWLIANHHSGGTMTYPDMSHVHMDIGQHFVSLAGGRHYASRSGSGRHYAQRSSGRHYAERKGRRYAQNSSHRRWAQSNARRQHVASQTYSRRKRLQSDDS